MSNERLEIVTEFGSLKAGDLVVVKACAGCGATHRSILVKFHPRVAFVSGRVDAAWEGAPLKTCENPTATRPANVSSLSVREGRAYRVVIPPAEEARETARPRKLERVR